MTKLVSALTLALFAAVTFNAQAASHTGGAPMAKASEPMAKASGAMKKDAKKEEKKEMKKEEPKK
jgi:ribosomal protein L12E/L44/L45/RPP1/RPP2